jgi:hypothetical protein
MRCASTGPAGAAAVVLLVVGRTLQVETCSFEDESVLRDAAEAGSLGYVFS